MLQQVLVQYFLLLLNNISLNEYTAFYLLIHQLFDPWVDSTFWLLWIVIKEELCTSFYVDICLLLLGQYLEGNCWGLWELLNILRSFQMFFQVAAPFYIPCSNARVFHFFHVLTNTCEHIFLTVVNQLVWSGTVLGYVYSNCWPRTKKDCQLFLKQK